MSFDHSSDWITATRRTFADKKPHFHSLNNLELNCVHDNTEIRINIYMYIISQSEASDVLLSKPEQCSGR